MKESLFDTREFSKERQTALQAQSEKIKVRLDKLYVDKLDGNISNEFWVEKKTQRR